MKQSHASADAPEYEVIHYTKMQDPFGKTPSGAVHEIASGAKRTIAIASKARLNA